MEQREALADVRAKRDVAAARELTARVKAREESTLARLTEAFAAADGARDALVPLVATLGELRYYRRFLEEASAVLDDLGGAS
jgi:molecular chaperone HscB